MPLRSSLFALRSSLLPFYVVESVKADGREETISFCVGTWFVDAFSQSEMYLFVKGFVCSKNLNGYFAEI